MHSGIGPSSALSIGVAIATYVQAKPTIRINILTARFMVFSLRCETPGRKPRGCGIIQGTDRPSSLFPTGRARRPAKAASEELNLALALRVQTLRRPVSRGASALILEMNRGFCSSTRRGYYAAAGALPRCR